MGPRLLVVEDEPDIVALPLMIFDPHEYEVLVARDLAAVCTALMSRRRFHLVALDLLLPDGNDLDLAER